MQQALLLDRNYVALSIVPLRKAVKLLVKGKAEPVCGTKACSIIKSVTGNFVVPTIIRLLVVIPWRAHIGIVRFSRKNVISRDGGECQYCGTKIGKHATIDHILPQSRGGKSDYINCVASCHDCNNKKADRTPEEAGMKLKQKPKKPTFLSLYKSFLQNPPEEWCTYIMGLATNEDSI
jgi:5-methylcytosine-specific restriction endonuclease McrA